MNLITNRVCRILGKVENTERFLGLTLYQGIPGTGGRTKRLGAGISPSESDPMLVACAYTRQRLYMFSRREPPDTDEVATGRCFTSTLPGRPSGLRLLAGMLWNNGANCCILSVPAQTVLASLYTVKEATSALYTARVDGTPAHALSKIVVASMQGRLQ